MTDEERKQAYALLIVLILRLVALAAYMRDGNLRMDAYMQRRVLNEVGKHI